jgi:proteasome activator subunit 4
MSVLEPALILYPILERAVPSLEALVEVCLKYSLFELFNIISLAS